MSQRNLLNETIQKIHPVDPSITESAECILEEKMHGDGAAFGTLKDLLFRYLAICNTADADHIHKPKYATVIACADHGVAEEAVSAYPIDTTVEMMKNYLISRGGAANAFSSFIGSELLVVDMGTKKDIGDLPGLIKRRIANGTKNMAHGAAMTREEAVTSLEVGIELAQKLISRGINIILPGEMGISNTTASAAITAAVCHMSAEEVTGRGTNISDQRLKHKTEIVRKILAVNIPDARDGIDVLAKVGGFEFGCIAGLILGAAAGHAAVILDGANSSAAALIAATLSPHAVDYLIVSHLASEKSHRESIKHLGLTPFLSLDLRLGEAIGSSIASSILNHMIGLWQLLAHLPEKPEIPRFEQKCMPKFSQKITDKTFDFYLRTMQDLDKESMEKCRHRLDNLAKPIHSLGFLEEIAIEIAGIIGEERPATDQNAALVIFTKNKLPLLLEQMIGHMSDDIEVPPYLATLYEGLSAYAAFNFGRDLAEELSLSYAVLGLAFGNSEDEDIDQMSRELRKALLTETGELRYDPEDFLRHAPEKYQEQISAFMGAMIAAAHNCTLILLDDAATEIIARYTEHLCPAVQPYLLHVQPRLITAGVRLPSGILNLFGLSIVYAALNMLNEMKTFAETSVSVATDGPGAKRQRRV